MVLGNPMLVRSVTTVACTGISEHFARELGKLRRIGCTWMVRTYAYTKRAVRGWLPSTICYTIRATMGYI